MTITQQGVFTNDDEVLVFEVDINLEDGENRRRADAEIDKLMEKYPAAAMTLHNLGHKFVHDMDYVWHDLEYVYMIGYDKHSNKHYFTVEKSSGELVSTRRL